MDNLQKAINYETIVNATHLSDTKTILMYNQLCSWCDISASIGDNLEAYKFITGCDENTLYKAQLEVVKAFETLSDDVQIISPDNILWPTDVKEVPFLYLRGDASLLKRPAISIVGTRQASEEGIKLTQQSVDALGNDYVIVSGLAKGVDAAAHIQALKKGFNTIAVIGTPICSYYPPDHKQLQDYISLHGLVVSQFGPSRRIQQYFFIQRNLTMSEISGGTLIIESSDTGGGVKQAQYSAKQNKCVFIYEDTYKRTDISWPKTFETAVLVPDVQNLLSCVNNPVKSKGSQSSLFD